MNTDPRETIDQAPMSILQIFIIAITLGLNAMDGIDVLSISLAAPDIAKKNIAMPIEYAIPKVHRFLTDEGVRDKICLMASGGIRTAFDVAKAIALGADGAVIGTSELVALGCKRCENCERGRGCPSGIATTDPILMQSINPAWGSQRIINMYNSWKGQWGHILAALQLENIRELRAKEEVKFKKGCFNHLVHLDHLR